MGEVTIKKSKGGLGRQAPTIDGISGLVLTMPSITGGATVGEVYKLGNVEDAETLLITEANDKSTEYLCWEHINDFFRINPDGTLYIYIANPAYPVFHASVTAGVRSLLNYTNGEINQIGVAYNGDIPANTTGILDAIAKAQQEATLAATNHSPIHILMDGIKLTQVEDMRQLNSPNVTVVAAQNLAVVNYDNGGAGVIDPAVDNPWEFHTAVGLALGAVSKAAVNESIAWVEEFNLYGGNLSAAGVKGLSIVGQETLLSTLEDKGYLTMRTYKGFAGIYFNAAPTATSITSDYATIQNNRTINKAIRLIRKALLPYLNSPINVDNATGKLRPAVVKNFENVGRRALDPMSRNEEFSSAVVTVDPTQNILSTSELKLSLEITPTGTAESIVVNVGFVNPFN